MIYRKNTENLSIYRTKYRYNFIPSIFFLTIYRKKYRKNWSLTEEVTEYNLYLPCPTGWPSRASITNSLTHSLTTTPFPPRAGIGGVASTRFPGLV